VKVAISNGWLVNHEKEKGKTCRLGVGEALPDEGGLPEPEVLISAIGKRCNPATQGRDEVGVAGLHAIPTEQEAPHVVRLHAVYRVGDRLPNGKVVLEVDENGPTVIGKAPLVPDEAFASAFGAAVGSARELESTSPGPVWGCRYHPEGRNRHCLRCNETAVLASQAREAANEH
jgi:hypothetical protein